MTRNTYLMTLQFALWPVALLTLTLVAQVWTADKVKIDGHILLWATEAGLFLVANVWADTLWELFNNVAYIEHELKKRISAEVGSDALWGYEPYLAAQRGPNPALWELALPVTGALTIVATVGFRWPLLGWEYLAAIFTIALEVRLGARCLAAVGLRRHFTDRLLEIPLRADRKNHDRRWLVVAITILAGILPLTVIAYRTKTLWFGSRVDSPLMAVPSVWLGDSVFLPIFNCQIVAFFQVFFSSESGTKSRHIFLRSLALALVVSSVIAGYSHYMWTQDQFLGFIDTSYGSLSTAGWWHLGFTIIQMALVFTFILIWLRTARVNGARSAYGYGVLAWRTFFGYALLCIADFAVFHLYSLPRRPLHDYDWHTAWQGLLVVPFWFVVKTLCAFGKAE